MTEKKTKKRTGLEFLKEHGACDARYQVFQALKGKPIRKALEQATERDLRWLDRRLVEEARAQFPGSDYYACLRKIGLPVDATYLYGPRPDALDILEAAWAKALGY